MISYFINCKTLQPTRRSPTHFIIVDGISLNTKLKNKPEVWRIPFGFQLVPAGIMLIGLFTVKVRVLRIFEYQPFLNYMLGISPLACLCW